MIMWMRCLLIVTLLNGSICACASVLPALAVAASIASEALHWIDAVDSFVAPQLDAVDTGTARRVQEAIARARAAAALLEHASRGADAVAQRDMALARIQLERALTDLFVLTQPLGVSVAKPGPVDVERMGAERTTLAVPSPSAIVHGGP